MRIVGGVWSGRRLSVPAGSGVRPTADRVREAVFNMLYGIGLPDGATVVDAFCGTGALGVEALSRGAAHVTFVDTDRAVCDALAATLDELGAEPERRRIVCGDAVSFAAGAAGFDLLLADPP
ncbi:MAG TPA: 16S rRNA (guanine(966)-N(2))-methyltransferase RsmD, partial [Acidimicrobiaceae bacterium]|nr:16S rRNA (guanine(966)-N(2))-methyltransferase RsmD [Acidimicrobiaceae bacterium]HCB37648.1 16S rRNA (guanine(966)-N(2))-methyltransferase RsmD [Acidimicrobiaceae bacterium]